MPEITDRLNELLESSITFNGKEAYVKDLLLAKLIDKAIKGDIKSIQLLLDRAYGKASEKIEVTGKDGKSFGFDNHIALQEVDKRIAELIEHTENNINSSEITD